MDVVVVVVDDDNDDRLMTACSDNSTGSRSFVSLVVRTTMTSLEIYELQMTSLLLTTKLVSAPLVVKSVITNQFSS